MKLARYAITLAAMSPLHIGTGGEWERDADFVEEGGQDSRSLRVVDVDGALLDMNDREVASIRDGGIARACGSRIRERHTRFLLPVFGSGNVGQVRELIRAPDQRPYIPGSTIKGAIRTALLNVLASDDKIARVGQGPRESPRAAGYAAVAVEREAFSVPLAPGRRNVSFPHRDLHRAVRVSDFFPRGEPRVGVVRVDAERVDPGRRGAAIPIWCEAVLPGASFAGEVSVESDTPLWRAMSPEQRSAAERVLTTWFEHAKELARAEMAVWQTADPKIAEFYRRVVASGGMHAVLGWGGGWSGKTVGSRISPATLDAVAHRYDLRRWRGREFPHRFPVTRRVAYGPEGPQPLGWVGLSDFSARTE